MPHRQKALRCCLHCTVHAVWLFVDWSLTNVLLMLRRAQISPDRVNPRRVVSCRVWSCLAHRVVRPQIRAIISIHVQSRASRAYCKKQIVSLVLGLCVQHAFCHLFCEPSPSHSEYVGRTHLSVAEKHGRHGGGTHREHLTVKSTCAAIRSRLIRPRAYLGALVGSPAPASRCDLPLMEGVAGMHVVGLTPILEASRRYSRCTGL